MFDLLMVYTNTTSSEKYINQRVKINKICLRIVHEKESKNIINFLKIRQNLNYKYEIFFSFFFNIFFNFFLLVFKLKITNHRLFYYQVLTV